MTKIWLSLVTNSRNVGFLSCNFRIRYGHKYKRKNWKNWKQNWSELLNDSKLIKVIGRTNNELKLKNTKMIYSTNLF